MGTSIRRQTGVERRRPSLHWRDVGYSWAAAAMLTVLLLLSL